VSFPKIVSKYMIRRRGPPSQRPWGTFIRSHADAHDGQRIPSKYDAYLGTELIVRASATPLLAAARALVALTV